MSHAPRKAVQVSVAACRRFAPRLLAASLFFASLYAAAVPPVLAQTTPPPAVVISQLYTRGGEAGSTYQSDYVELFNRGDSTADLNGFALQIGSASGTTSMISFVSSSSIQLAPGKRLLVELARGTEGQPLPSPDFPAPPSNINFLNLNAAAGYVALYRRAPTLQFGVCPSGEELLDTVGYGSAGMCREGTAIMPAPSQTQALLRKTGGCTDANNNAADFETAAPNPRNGQTPATTCSLPSGSDMFQFSLLNYQTGEGAHRFVVTVTRTGGPAAATVDYATFDGTANERQDYTTATGTLRFDAGETVKTFDVLLTDDVALESNETVLLKLSNPTGGATLGPRDTATLVIQDNDLNASAPNPADDPTFFARQHYHDFLNREPDAGGLAFWADQAINCDNTDQQACRVNTSAAFFLSIEFQQTGFLVHRLYRVAFPEGSAARPLALPRFREFVRDTQRVQRGVVVNQGDWQLTLMTNARQFAEEFANRPEFLARYGGLSNAAYVDALNANAGGVVNQQLRDQWVQGLDTGGLTRHEVLRLFAENRLFTAAEKNHAFVLMQYFGYLRRDPDAEGFDFWLTKLNNHNGDFISSEMVNSFIISSEYRGRFAATANTTAAAASSQLP